MDKSEKRKLAAEFAKVPLEQRAVIYARYSTQNQTPESIERQISDCREYAARRGLTIVREYYDEAKSGTQTLTRDNYNQMLEDSADHLFSKVIVFKFDRFSRNLRDFLNDEYRLNMNGVQLLSTIEVTPEGISGKLIKYIVLIAAELYADSVADHTTAAVYRNAAQGNYNGGKIPYGYNVVSDGDHKKLVIDEEEAEILLAMFKMYAEGKSYADLVDYLCQIGARNKSGVPFCIGSFNSIFRNRIYVGEYGYGKRTDKAIVTKRPDLQIVPDEIMEKVKQRMAENKVLAGRKRGKRSYILSGFVTCGKCGRKMHHSTAYKTTKKGKLPYAAYYCPGTGENDAQGNKKCDNLRVRRKYLERYVMDKIIRGLFGNASLKDVTEKLNAYILSQAKESERELEAQRKLLKKHKDSLERLKLQKEDGKDGLNWDKQIKKVKMNIRGTKKAIRKLELKRDSMTCTPDEVIQLIMLIRSKKIKKLDAVEIRDFMDAYLDCITVDDKYVRVQTKLNEIVKQTGEAA